jgi:sterol desaturase/sphingolipid hydroxylase (fatty acid hydroxylase superfamily)
MYTLATTAYIFFILCPGVLFTIPPGVNIIYSALFHMLIFWAVITFLPPYVPWYAFFIMALVLTFAKAYFASRAPL